eukprot:Unigene12424_Nuclearia_a/m.37751 Unigene12424_Nuclearia_a/g.37751  ORF Unigene12424_Nuclearia_a/g.37751 Unigene12424_Nuclearia_a/m.37751 type:complete len:257 (+) Unigene12424_Nuclearia_a:2-772(+)
MKLTAELISLSAQFTNALKERELDLRSNKIPQIENLGATLDQFDTIDLSDNEIRRVENFPLLKRLGTLLISNNRVGRVAPDLQQALPRLHTLVLNNNLLSELADLQPMAQLTSLRTLSLIDNPCTRKQHYRLYVVHIMPHLTLLDFRRIKLKERQEAAALFKGAEGKSLESAINAQRTFVPGSVSDEPKTAGLSAEDAARIRAAINNSTSLDEIARLERVLKSGGMPEAAGANGSSSGGGLATYMQGNQIVEMEED